MKTILRGQITKYVPSFQGHVAAGKLVLSENGKLALTVDSGFSGGIALPQEILELLDKQFMGHDIFTLATGDIVVLPTYRGNVIVKQQQIVASLIPGDSLIGMEFLSSAGTMLSLNLRKNLVRLSK